MSTVTSQLNIIHKVVEMNILEIIKLIMTTVLGF